MSMDFGGRAPIPESDLGRTPNQPIVAGAGSAATTWTWLLTLLCLVLGVFPGPWHGGLVEGAALIRVAPVAALSVFALVSAVRLERGGRGSFALILIAVLACLFNSMWLQVALRGLL